VTAAAAEADGDVALRAVADRRVVVAGTVKSIGTEGGEEVAAAEKVEEEEEEEEEEEMEEEEKVPALWTRVLPRAAYSSSSSHSVSTGGAPVSGSVTHKKG
jgi:hypothetical protein